MTTQQHTYQEMNARLDRIETAMMHRRLDNLERSLVSRNTTTDRVLAACRRIQWQWTKPADRADREQ